MQIVTLTTDWGLKDWYVGQIKGVLYSRINDVNVVDITHQIPKFDIRMAAIVVQNACFTYPKGTIHIIDINTFEGDSKSFIVVKYNDQFFICTDNGLPSMIFKGLDVEITDMTNYVADSNYYTYAVLDFFVKIADVLSQTHSLENLGNKKNDFAVRKEQFTNAQRGNSIECQIIYIDDYGNAYLNIKDKEFLGILNNRKFEIFIDVGATITSFSTSYADKSIAGQPLMTVSSMCNLELAVRGDNFSRLFGKKVGDKITINIKD